MSRFTKMIRIMLLEEYRTQTAILGPHQFFFFPLLIAAFSFALSAASPTLLQRIPQAQVYIILHGIVFGYGFISGGFALFSEAIAERRFKNVGLIISSSVNLPIKFKTTFLAFYIKDIIYYIAFTIAPLILGITLSVPITKFSLFSIGLLLVGLIMAFLLGISIMFLVSLAYMKKPKIVLPIMAVVAAALLGGRALGRISFSDVIITTRFQLAHLNNQPAEMLVYSAASLGLFALLSVAASMFIDERIEYRRKYRSIGSLAAFRNTFAFFGAYSTLLAKEWADIKRSGTLFPLLGAYMGPLVFLGIISWVLQNAFSFQLVFNGVFYGAMIGFLGVNIYSWLNNIDPADFYQTMPILASQVIRTKLIMFALLTSWVSTLFVILISVVNGSIGLLPLSLFVSFSATAYTVCSVAYLTGLRPNIQLFDWKVLGKFGLMVMPPLIVITISSFYLDPRLRFFEALYLICSLSALLFILSAFLYRAINKRWAIASFEV